VVITRYHLAFYTEIFALPGFLTDPVAVFGFQDFSVKGTRPGLRSYRRWLLGRGPKPRNLPTDFRVANLTDYLHARGMRDVRVIDLFDARAECRYDMNHPVPAEEHERYGTFIDIGSIEHVFDTRQCLENELRMVRPGGVYMVMTPVSGYRGHGLHTFHPDVLPQALEINGFEILYRRYATKHGVPLERPAPGQDALIWLVGRKRSPLEKFQVPQQQAFWEEYYRAGD